MKASNNMNPMNEGTKTKKHILLTTTFKANESGGAPEDPGAAGEPTTIR
jgi:hypothetical protein